MDRKLVQVERGNVVLRVPDDDVQRYIDNGYNLIDDNGNVLQSSVPKDLGTLQRAYEEQTARVKELESEIEKLKSAKSPASRSRKKQ